MSMVTIGQDGWLNLNANEISSVEFNPGDYDRYTRTVMGQKTIILMRNGSKFTMGELSQEGKDTLMEKIREAQS